MFLQDISLNHANPQADFCFIEGCTALDFVLISKFHESYIFNLQIHWWATILSLLNSLQLIIIIDTWDKILFRIYYTSFQSSNANAKTNKLLLEISVAAQIVKTFAL